MASKVTTINVATTIIDLIQSDMDWVANTAADVNPIPADAIVGYTLGGGANDPTAGAMSYINYSKTPGGGGLISRDYECAPSTDGSPMWFAMDWLIYIAAKHYPSIMRLELDDKVMLGKAAGVTPVPALQMNESHQFRPDTGAWQYDPDGNGWQDIGFVPAPLKLDAVNEFRFRWMWNGKLGAAGLWSSIEMAQNGETFALPAKFRNLPLIAQAWGGPLRHPQVQTELEGAAPWHGITLVRGRLVQSSQAIDIALPW